jgi:hypothetical protein
MKKHEFIFKCLVEQLVDMVQCELFKYKQDESSACTIIKTFLGDTCVSDGLYTSCCGYFNTSLIGVCRYSDTYEIKIPVTPQYEMEVTYYTNQGGIYITLNGYRYTNMYHIEEKKYYGAYNDDLYLILNGHDAREYEIHIDELREKYYSEEWLMSFPSRMIQVQYIADKLQIPYKLSFSECVSKVYYYFKQQLGINIKQFYIEECEQVPDPIKESKNDIKRDLIRDYDKVSDPIQKYEMSSDNKNVYEQYAIDVKIIRTKYDNMINELRIQYEKELDEINSKVSSEEYNKRYHAMKDKHDNDVDIIRQCCDDELGKLANKFSQQISTHLPHNFDDDIW